MADHDVQLYADVSDVRRAYEQPIPDDSPLADRTTYWLEVVSERLTAVVPSLPHRIAVGEASAVIARDMVVRAVMRALRNPSEAMTQSQTAGPYANSVGYGAAATTANRSYFDPEDLALLQPTSPIGLRSVALTIPSWRLP